jgi:hypothetical protein
MNCKIKTTNPQKSWFTNYMNYQIQVEKVDSLTQVLLNYSVKDYTFTLFMFFEYYYYFFSEINISLSVGKAECSIINFSHFLPMEDIR